MPKQLEARIPTAGSSICFLRYFEPAPLAPPLPLLQAPPSHPTPPQPKRAHHRIDVRAVLQQEQHRFLALGVHGHVQGGEP